MLKNKITLSVITGAVLLSFSGCNSGNSAIPTQTLSGQVIGSHYEGAKVCVDLNSNLKCDSNEPSAISDVNGEWSIANISSYGSNILSEIPKGSIKHTMYPTPTSVSVSDPLVFVAPAESVDSNGKVVVSAISTMVYETMRDEKITFSAAKTATVEKIGVNPDELFINFDVANPTPSMLKLQAQSDVETPKIAKQVADANNNDITPTPTPPSPTPVVPEKINGKVIGSHYEGAKVFIDLNNNLAYDENEPSTISANDGSWELKNPNNGGLNIIADISAGNIVYSSYSLPVMKKVKKPVKFIASLKAVDGSGNIMLSPISTMIWQNMKENSSSFESAKSAVAKEVGVSENTLLSNYDVEATTKELSDMHFASDMELYELEIEPISNTVQGLYTSKTKIKCKPKSGIFNFMKKDVEDVTENPEEDAELLAMSSYTSDISDDDDPELDKEEPDTKDNPNPNYTCNLGKMGAMEKNIEGNVSQINTELQVADELLTKIYAQMQIDNFQDAQAYLNNFMNYANTAWTNFSDDIPSAEQNATNLSIVQDCDTMKRIVGSDLYNSASQSNLSNLVTAVNELLGNGIDSPNGYIKELLQSAVNYNEIYKINITQGTKSTDIVTKMSQASNNIFKVYTQLATAIQQVYNLEAANLMFLYSQNQKLMCDDKSIPEFQAYDYNLNASNDLTTNMEQLNKLFDTRFEQLQKIIIDNAHLYSDHIGQIDANLAKVIYSTTSYPGVPQGTYNNDANLSKAGTLFTPFILFTTDFNSTGYYDGLTLTSMNMFDRNSTTSLKLDTCLTPSTDEPELITWGATTENNVTSTKQVLTCGWIKAVMYSWQTNDPVLWNTDETKAPWDWSYGVDHKNESGVIYDSSFNTFFDSSSKQINNGDGFVMDSYALSSTGKMHPSLGQYNLQTIQFTSPEGEKALFQFGIADSADRAKRMSITCGENTGTFKDNDGNSWTCSDVMYADDIVEKLFITFPRTNKSYTIFVGARGEGYHNEDDPQTYFDFCVKGDDECAKKLNYYTNYKTYEE